MKHNLIYLIYHLTLKVEAFDEIIVFVFALDLYVNNFYCIYITKSVWAKRIFLY